LGCLYWFSRRRILLLCGLLVVCALNHHLLHDLVTPGLHLVDVFPGCCARVCCLRGLVILRHSAPIRKIAHVRIGEGFIFVLAPAHLSGAVAASWLRLITVVCLAQDCCPGSSHCCLGQGRVHNSPLSVSIYGSDFHTRNIRLQKQVAWHIFTNKGKFWDMQVSESRLVLLRLAGDVVRVHVSRLHVLVQFIAYVVCAQHTPGQCIVWRETQDGPCCVHTQ
jgi:energy-converting hydrogenase Eha subunit C